MQRPGVVDSVGAGRVPNRWGEGQRLRQEILDAAGRLLRDVDGPERVSLRAIAREAGISAGAVYSHFKDKNDLMWTLLDGAYTALSEQMCAARDAAPADDPWAGLRATVDSYCELATGAPHRYDLLFRIGPGLPPPQGLQQHPMARLLDVWRETVVAYLTATGHGSDGADLTAKLLWSGLHGQLGLWRNVSPLADDVVLEDLRDGILRALFGRD
ncbi:TetR/AcrR family transcriptional regulator [Promicromonospora sp. NFX87]|uniref:TetR/AcrR family transcriptional regulator n=1 Tax=Promicromonospora sp. NFX87 TaxID=3402691 RepID=UPI003AFAF86D